MASECICCDLYASPWLTISMHRELQAKGDGDFRLNTQILVVELYLVMGHSCEDNSF
jgi:hypothetical protein